MSYIDSHAHLCGDELYQNIEEIIGSFPANNIKRVMLICCSKKDYQRALVLKEKYPYFDIAKGIHPESADKDRTSDLYLLQEELKEGKIDLIGEIGLDYYWTKETKERQKELFIKQLEIADESNLPIAVHSRDASEDTYQILKEHHKSKSGVLHCFSGSKEMALRYLKLGYYLSFAGPITFSNAKTTAEVAASIPLDRLLYETDCPYLTPVPFRGKCNNPNLVIYTANKLAELHDVSIEVLNKQIEINYERLLGRDRG